METTSSDIPANAVIEASKVDNQTRINQVIDYIKTNKLVAFDISLLGNNGYITKINNGTVTIKIPLPEGYVENDTKVYYVSDDGKTGETFEVTYETIEGKRYIVFETDHFSTYVVAEKKEESTVVIDKEEPKTTVKEPSQTGDTTLMLPFVMLAVLGASGLMLLKKNKQY